MPENNFLLKYKIHHLLFWLLLFSGWYYFRYQDYPKETAFVVTLIKVAELAVTVYITNYLLIPKLIYKKKYVLFALFFLVMIAASSFFKLYLILHIISPLQSVFANVKERIYDNVIPHFLLVSTGAAFKLVLDYAKAQRQIAEITKEKSSAELSFLKSQINPHFVFNSLNAVYFLIDKNNADARNVLHKFSDMLRFQLYELDGEKITLEKEITYLENYVDLQKLRLEQCSVSFNRPINKTGLQVEPLLLIPFVENAFKHISHYSDKANEIKISLETANNEMKFIIQNTTEGMAIIAVNKQGGIGLANVQRRLELLYPAKHSLKISENNGWFNVELLLQTSNAEM